MFRIHTCQFAAKSSVVYMVQAHCFEYGYIRGLLIRMLWYVQVVGDVELAAKFEESALTIRRDIVFAASLYI